jgi:hypothetical protein
MIAVALAYGLGEDSHRLGTRLAPCRGMMLPIVPECLRGGTRLVKPSQLGSEGVFQCLCIGRGKLVLEGKGALRPGGKPIRLGQLLKFRE